MEGGSSTRSGPGAGSRDHRLTGESFYWRSGANGVSIYINTASPFSRGDCDLLFQRTWEAERDRIRGLATVPQLAEPEQA